MWLNPFYPRLRREDHYRTLWGLVGGQAHSGAGVAEREIAYGFIAQIRH
jgi:hypothetical protein